MTYAAVEGKELHYIARKELGCKVRLGSRGEIKNDGLNVGRFAEHPRKFFVVVIQFSQKLELYFDR